VINTSDDLIQDFDTISIQYFTKYGDIDINILK